MPKRVYLPAIYFLILSTFTNAVPIHRHVRMTREAELVNDTIALTLKVEQHCMVDGISYSPGAPVPGGLCQSCQCRPPGLLCEQIQCEKKSGCRAVQLPGQCCPTYQCECEIDGRIYANGERIEGGDPCQACYCQGGHVVCTDVTCYHRAGCEPRSVPGKCCPQYDHCPPIETLTSKHPPSSKKDKSTPVSEEAIHKREKSSQETTPIVPEVIAVTQTAVSTENSDSIIPDTTQVSIEATNQPVTQTAIQTSAETTTSEELIIVPATVNDDKKDKSIEEDDEIASRTIDIDSKTTEKELNDQNVEDDSKSVSELSYDSGIKIKEVIPGDINTGIRIKEILPTQSPELKNLDDKDPETDHHQSQLTETTKIVREIQNASVNNKSSAEIYDESSKDKEIHIYQDPPVFRIGDQLLFLNTDELIHESNASGTPQTVITVIGAEGLQIGTEEDDIHEHKELEHEVKHEQEKSEGVEHVSTSSEAVPLTNDENIAPSSSTEASDVSKAEAETTEAKELTLESSSDNYETLTTERNTEASSSEAVTIAEDATSNWEDSVSPTEAYVSSTTHSHDLEEESGHEHNPEYPPVDEASLHSGSNDLEGKVDIAVRILEDVDPNTDKGSSEEEVRTSTLLGGVSGETNEDKSSSPAVTTRYFSGETSNSSPMTSDENNLSTVVYQVQYFSEESTTARQSMAGNSREKKEDVSSIVIENLSVDSEAKTQEEIDNSSILKSTEEVLLNDGEDANVSISGRKSLSEDSDASAAVTTRYFSKEATNEDSVLSETSSDVSRITLSEDVSDVSDREDADVIETKNLSSSDTSSDVTLLEDVSSSAIRTKYYSEEVTTKEPAMNDQQIVTSEDDAPNSSAISLSSAIATKYYSEEVTTKEPTMNDQQIATNEDDTSNSAGTISNDAATKEHSSAAITTRYFSEEGSASVEAKEENKSSSSAAILTVYYSEEGTTTTTRPSSVSLESNSTPNKLEVDDIEEVEEIIDHSLQRSQDPASKILPEILQFKHNSTEKITSNEGSSSAPEEWLKTAAPTTEIIAEKDKSIESRESVSIESAVAGETEEVNVLNLEGVLPDTLLKSVYPSDVDFSATTDLSSSDSTASENLNENNVNHSVELENDSTIAEYFRKSLEESKEEDGEHNSSIGNTEESLPLSPTTEETLRPSGEPLSSETIIENVIEDSVLTSKQTSEKLEIEEEVKEEDSTLGSEEVTSTLPKVTTPGDSNESTTPRNDEVNSSIDAHSDASVHDGFYKTTADPSEVETIRPISPEQNEDLQPAESSIDSQVIDVLRDYFQSRYRT